jgi:hypothetical protein
MATPNTEALMEKVFKWKKMVEIDDTKFFMRVVSDQVVDDARRTALLESRKLRRSLRDKDSDDHLIYLDPIADLVQEELINLITLAAVRDVMRNYMQTTPRPVAMPLSDNPTQEEQENYEAEKEERDDAYAKDMQQYVESWRKEFVGGLEKKSETELLHLAKRYRTDAVCEDHFQQVFEDHVVSASLYKDEKYKDRAFTVQQFKQLPSSVKTRLVNAYNDLAVSADDVKN